MLEPEVGLGYYESRAARGAVGTVRGDALRIEQVRDMLLRVGSRSDLQRRRSDRHRRFRRLPVGDRALPGLAGFQECCSDHRRAMTRRVIFCCLIGLLPTAAMADQYKLLPWGTSRNNLEYAAIVFDETNGDVFTCTVLTDTLQTKVGSLGCDKATIQGDAVPPGPAIVPAPPGLTAVPLRFWKIDQNGKVTFCLGAPASFGPPHIFSCASTQL